MTTLTPAARQQLERGLSLICQQLGVTAQANLIKYTMNAVYRVDDYIIRLGHGPGARPLAHRVAAVSRALEAAGAPTVRLAKEVPSQPVTVGEWAATIWTFVHATGNPTPADLASPLKAFHAITSLPTDLPQWNILAKCRHRLTRAQELTGSDATHLDQWSVTELGHKADELLSMLNERADQIDNDLAAVQWHLPPGVIHGDAHTGNLIIPQRDALNGTAETILCDLDSVSIGPREWDLVPTAHGPTRFGRSRSDYRAFADAYGFDLTTWSGWPTLRQLRELQLVTSVLPSLTGRPDVATQLSHRLRSFLTYDDETTWTRYK